MAQSQVNEASTAIYPDMKGKVALITGIGQVGDQQMWGNGAATARTLARNGVKVYGCDLKLEAALHTQRRLLNEDGECMVEVADVTKSTDVQRLVKNCVDTYGQIDYLVNNVGMSMPGGAADMSESTWDAQIDVNLKSVYLLCHHVLPIMEAQGRGSIVNISSIAALGYIGKAQIAYNTAKSALLGFTSATAVQYAPKGIRMNVAMPGLIHTPLVGVLAEKYAGGDYQGLVERRNKAVPMGRMGDGFDVGNAVTFLLSDAARYITGHSLVVDGGITKTTGWSSG